MASFILTSNARNYSCKSISDYMRSCGISCSPNTVQKWIEYLVEAYVLEPLNRYSKKAKSALEPSRKIYNCDVALNSIRCRNNRYVLTHNLENIIYNELVFMGYSLSVYNDRGRGIDFVAEKNGKKFFVQAAYSIAEDKAYEREFSAFKSISQIDRKIIITNDDIDYSTSNVEHIRLKDFLVKNSLED